MPAHLDEREQRVALILYKVARRVSFSYSPRLYTFDDLIQENWLWYLTNKERLESFDVDRLEGYVYSACLYRWLTRLRQEPRPAFLGDNVERVAASERSRDVGLLERQKERVLKYVRNARKTKALQYAVMTLDNKRLCEISSALGVKPQYVYVGLKQFVQQARKRLLQEG